MTPFHHVLLIIPSVFLVALPIVVVLCDRLIPEAHAKAYRLVTHGLVAVWYVFSVATVGLLWWGDYLHDALKDRLAVQAGNAEEQRIELQQQLAGARSEAAALGARLEASLRDLREWEEAATVRPEYDFYGIRLQNGRREQKHDVGREWLAYGRMEKAALARSWDELAVLCEEEMKRTPEWLTPYYFAGIAYANKGETERARVLLDHVRKLGQSDPLYSDAGKLLRAMEEGRSIEFPRMHAQAAPR